MKAKEPKSNTWTTLEEHANGACYLRNKSGTTVISTLDMAEAPDGSGEMIPQWHISISNLGKRPSQLVVDVALKAFEMVGAEEDNHHPGNARHFWMPIDPERRVDCECKTDETVIQDPDGYTWTNPKDGSCRGCDLSRAIGKPCPLHDLGIRLAGDE